MKLDGFGLFVEDMPTMVRFYRDVLGFAIGEVTQMLYDTLTGIQWGKIEDTKGWIVPVCEG